MGIFVEFYYFLVKTLKYFFLFCKNSGREMRRDKNIWGLAFVEQQERFALLIELTIVNDLKFP